LGLELSIRGHRTVINRYGLAIVGYLPDKFRPHTLVLLQKLLQDARL